MAPRSFKAKQSNIIKYSFKGTLWKSEGTGGWYFVTIPTPLSKKIRGSHADSEEGWGRLKASARIKKTSWKTSIWFNTRTNTYLLPVKSLIRTKENLKIGSIIRIQLHFEIDEWQASSFRKARLSNF